MENLIEIMDSSRRKMLAGLLFGFVMWQGFVILEFLLKLSGASHTLLKIFIPCVLAGAGVWLYYRVKFVSLNKKILSDPQLKDALNNELVRLNWKKSSQFSFVIVLVTLVMLSVISAFISVPGWFVGHIAFFIGIVSFISAFLVLDRS